jgi:formylglycine-generating enzyme required for sulfatase activity
MSKPRLFLGLSFILVLPLVATVPATANDVTITDVTVAAEDPVNDYILVEFNLSWDNSWRIQNGDIETWDAVWLFMKYRETPTGPWMHATLGLTGHVLPGGATIDVPSDQKGAFVYRSAVGTGTFDLTGVQLRWDYGTDGLPDDAENIDVAVFGIEMVYIPEGAFAAGSGGTENGAFILTTINTADATVAPTGLGELDGKAGGYPDGQTAPYNASWPNGYAAFYMQKYEISQGQYADFLNKLTFEQKNNRFPNATTNRHTISSSPGPVYSASVPDRACNMVSEEDGKAYMDWAALRPMTELEFEKASRGTVPPVGNEYAWGSTNLHATSYVVTNDGLPDATVDAGSATGNASYDVTDGALNGPVRVGIFAASSVSPTREEAGSSLYGVMELSGNLRERAINLASTEGKGFTPVHGDGSLTLQGLANESTWPTAISLGFRGGSWFDNADRIRVSDRAQIGHFATHRDSYFGFRGVRSAP